jgi:outer membrane protein W
MGSGRLSKEKFYHPLRAIMGITIRKLNIGVVVGAASLSQLSSVAFADGEKMSITVEGGLASSEFTRDKLGAPSDEVDSDIGLYGSVGVVRDIQPGWDWSASASSLNFAPNALTVAEGGGPGFESYTNEFDASFVNFDIGRNFDAAGAQLRIGFGIEALSTSQDKGLSLFDDPGSYFDSDISTSFVGLGPQVSAQGSMALQQGSPLSVYGGASAALTRGVMTYDKGLIGQNPDPFGDSATPFGGSAAEDEIANAFHGVLDAGIEYKITDSTTFRAGVRRDIFRFDSQLAADAPDELFLDEVTSDTAYVGVSVSF